MWRDRQFQWTIKDVGAPLLDSLAGGLYSKLEVFREYVQNAIDSYVDFRQATGREPENSVQVWIDKGNRALHVMDRGLGMNWNDISTAKAIAVSPKLSNPSKYVGFRGIGIWSGLSACDRILIETTKINEPYIYELTISCSEIVKHISDPIPIDELLEGRVRIREQEWDAVDHFTHVKLEGVHEERFAELLDENAITRYAEQYLPVPLDPDWRHPETNESYSQLVYDILADLTWTECIGLTVNNLPVYRRFPPPQTIKKPERREIRDSRGELIALAWICETNSYGKTKAIEIPAEATWVRNFAVRVKNFAIGNRGLYSDDATDSNNLDWYVGEIYVVDPDIRPDTKRSHFQPGDRHDQVISQLTKFYSTTALGARGWSAQVTTEQDADEARDIAGEITRLVNSEQFSISEAVTKLWPHLQDLEAKLTSSISEAEKIDNPEMDAERALIIRRYLRRPQVKKNAELALGEISLVRARIDALGIEGQDNSRKPREANGSKKRKSRARTKILTGIQVNPAALTVAGTYIGPITGMGDTDRADFVQRSLDTELFMDAIKATLAAILGDGSESYARVLERLPEELRRRGIDV